MVINTEQCKGCGYYKTLNGMDGQRCCHYLLMTLKRRGWDEDGTCHSRHEGAVDDAMEDD